MWCLPQDPTAGHAPRIKHGVEISGRDILQIVRRENHQNFHEEPSLNGDGKSGDHAGETFVASDAELKRPEYNLLRFAA